MKKTTRKNMRRSVDVKSRRGFTLVEVVVALVIIVLVSGISIGVVSIDNKTHYETIDMIEATNIAENAIECFRFAVRNGGVDKDTERKIFWDSFDKYISFENSKTTKITVTVEQQNSHGSVINLDDFTVTDGRVVVSISLNFDDNSITITATNGGTNEFLLEPKTYTVR